MTFSKFELVMLYAITFHNKHKLLGSQLFNLQFEFEEYFSKRLRRLKDKFLRNKGLSIDAFESDDLGINNKKLHDFTRFELFKYLDNRILKSIGFKLFEPTFSESIYSGNLVNVANRKNSLIYRFKDSKFHPKYWIYTYKPELLFKLKYLQLKSNIFSTERLEVYSFNPCLKRINILKFDEILNTEIIEKEQIKVLSLIDYWEFKEECMTFFKSKGIKLTWLQILKLKHKFLDNPQGFIENEINSVLNIKNEFFLDLMLIETYNNIDIKHDLVYYW